jgi:hypothetical protein
MFDALKKMVEPTPPAAVTIEALEARVVEAQSKVDANRAAVKKAALAVTRDPAATDAFEAAKRLHLAALGELDAINDALDELRVLRQQSLDDESVAKKAAHDARVRETAEARKAAAEKLHAGAIKFAKLHKSYVDASTEFADALAPSGTAQRQMSVISGDAIVRRIQLDLLTLGIRWACKIPISISNVKPFIPTIAEETDYLAGQACDGVGQ